MTKRVGGRMEIEGYRYQPSTMIHVRKYNNEMRVNTKIPNRIINVLKVKGKNVKKAKHNSRDTLDFHRLPSLE